MELPARVRNSGRNLSCGEFASDTQRELDLHYGGGVTSHMAECTLIQMS